MKSFSDVKKRMTEGAELELIRHDWLSSSSKITVGMVRKIIKRQSNAVQFEGGSWLYFPKASDVVTNGDNEFSVVLSIEKAQFMSYRFI